MSKTKWGGDKENLLRYYPQGLIELDKPIINKAKEHGSALYHIDNKQDSIQHFTNYPCELLEFDNVGYHGGTRFHPTQKPIVLLEYLIRTYTLENEIVLDNCMGVGSTGVACMNSNRNFIGIELDQSYYSIAERRIEDAKENKEKP